MFPKPDVQEIFSPAHAAKQFLSSGYFLKIGVYTRLVIE
jgi:hypothetical protein